jgi:thiol-disulfide isomerase/thioredoxin
VFAALKRSLGAEIWIRRTLGVAVLAGVVVIAFGLDRSLLTRISLASTSGVEQSLIDRLRPGDPSKTSAKMPDETPARPTASLIPFGKPGDLAGSKTMPDLSGAVSWLNSAPLTPDELKGKVVLVDFWTYSCINCLRTLPYIREWARKYKDSGLVVIGVHTPEFAFEKDPDNVRRAVGELNITYPVALDNDFKIWRGFDNSYWPADYLIDGVGRIREHHFGEGGYDETERQIQELLSELGGQSPSSNGLVAVTGTGAEAPADNDVQSPETYVGYDRAEGFISPGGLRRNVPYLYSAPKRLALNHWGLSGNWIDRAEAGGLASAPGTIVYRFHARDLHLVLGPAADGKPVRFRVKIDGQAPGANHGIDTDEQGDGTITEHRLYQLIRQNGAIEDRTFEIEFLDPGAQAFAFTFG